ncbi:alpha/beta fold hydrolase [Paracoccus spongiarum]|uniref:Alpha/beta hydrolase n=1 Tax=Paracoccus spongiarum TaxID=3064387 RepID=A0ABT9J8I3_9RHOB|nr:alpha/beta hydrolase [Paracoccus sp. 2205BS29-5]MDP5306119.1 alpha/beta hydrolase [Paracoccus sp. 2205BS29-5]
MQRSRVSSVVTDHRAASPAGTLPARLIQPASRSGLPPLVVLHGISRNADELVDLFRPEAEASGRPVLVPHFSASRWPHFQRPCRAARPDQALLALMGHLAGFDPAFAGRLDVFGHSGGAQLAHRFAMLYPQRLRRLGLAAAGWYCLPDAGMSHPCGIGADADPDTLVWARRHRAVLAEYLGLRVEVYVGTLDVGRDETLRQTPRLDREQGPNRLARAETYVARFRAAARAQGIRPDIALIRLPGVAHDVAQAIRQAGLARCVTHETPALASAC